MTYKIAVCDDEQIFIDDVVAKLKEQSEQCEISEYTSGEELLDSLLDFNIIFLDIEMMGINGINTAFSLREQKYDGMIIFLTSHTEFMPDAFKVKAFRFLDKPLDDEKFNEAFTEAKKEILNAEHILLSDRSGKKYILNLRTLFILRHTVTERIFTEKREVFMIPISRLNIGKNKSVQSIFIKYTNLL